MRPTPSRRGRRAGTVRLALILGSLIAFGPLSIDMYLPAFPEMAPDLGASASAIQLTLTACILGLATGQLVAGPTSDARGRRAPLFVGLAAYAAASLVCAVAPNVWVLAGARFLQGFAGAAGIVISRAVARDTHSGVELARFFATLMLVNGLAPILAPMVGAQVLRVSDWRGVFVVLAAIGAALLVAAAAGLPESLPPEERRSGGARVTLGRFGALLRDRAFCGYAVSTGLAMAVMFAYIAGSSFVLQEVEHLSEQQFSLCFGANAVGIVLAGQLGRALVASAGARDLYTAGLVVQAVGTCVALVAVLAHAGLVLLLPGLFLAVASVGLVTPNAQALALQEHAEVAGSASALLGLLQFAVGAAIAPLVGIAGSRTAVPMVLVMVALSASALVVRFGPRPARG